MKPLRSRSAVSLILLLLFVLIRGDFEQSLSHCCTLGTKWGQENLKCTSFPAPVVGIANEQQAVCLSAVHICCLRKHRERQCDLGKQSARADRECSVTRDPGGEYHKDCCEGCKLGLVAGSMSASCSLRVFQFGIPWDEAYFTCCQQARPQPIYPASVNPPRQTSPRNPPLVGPVSGGSPPLPPAAANPIEEVDEDLCARFPGELCAQICVPTAGSYRCECRDGFQLLADGKSCQQAAHQDRCAAPTNPCSQKCTDTGLAIECSCLAGYRLAPDQRTCLDVDECSLGVDTCDLLTQLCVNEPGSYSCVQRENPPAASGQQPPHSPDENRCPRGFKFNSESRVCDDVDECAWTGHLAVCQAPTTCQNTIGSFTCVRAPLEDCPLGFRMNPATLTCIDIDECKEKPDICPRGRPICVNVQGSYSCQARDENAVLSPTVTCPAGYKFNHALQTCEDVDECAEKLDSCLVGSETCINDLGAYHCEPLVVSNSIDDYRRPTSSDRSDEDQDTALCPPGYSYNDEEQVCIDLDECLNGRLEERPVCVEPGRQRCVNTEGSFRCVAACRPGYRPIDIEEMLDQDDDNSEDEDVGCVDIDECAAGIHSCTLAEKCVNTQGAYNCESLRPSIVQTASFTSTPTTSVQRPTRPTRPTTTTARSTTTTTATTTPLPTTTTTRVTTISRTHTRTAARSTTASPPSDCQIGFRKDSATGRCKDINECEEDVHNCQTAEEDCVNTIGSFRCKPLAPCPSGFGRNVSTGRCDDIDECTDGTHNCPATSLCVNQYGAFNCRPFPFCASGHRYSIPLRYCVDIDECAEGLHNCSRQTQSCVNGVGNFRCVDREPECSFGYRYDASTRRCEDIDECVEGKDYCNPETEVCVNDRGGYRCAPKSAEATPPPPPPVTTSRSRIPCPRGYRFDDDSRRCVDVNECAESSPCRPNQQCENTVGSFVCRCGIGFRYNSATQNCEDINECLLDMHDCVNTQRCDNTIGSYTCVRTTSCGTGYTFNAETSFCEDDDECQLDTHDCHHLGPQYQCRNTEGSFRCERKRCEPGLTLDDNGNCVSVQCAPGFESGARGRCNDIDECARANPCPRAHRCVNTVGSYDCVSTLSCDAGYEPNESASECVDVDECARGSHDCRRNQVCQNRPGGFTCVCPQGFAIGANRECEDIDECTRYAGQICSSNSECVNTPGSYRCECRQGFRSGTDARSCVDIDECAETSRLCQHTCTNTWGSYHCSCQAGYTLGADGRSCQDVDECEQFRDRGGLCVGICVNEPGSYSCKCPEGYRLAADNRSCQDIDECATPNVCRADETCLNTRGGYYCNAIVCPPNYVRDQDHRNRCKRVSLECHSWDTECLRKPVSYSYNFLTLPSRIPIPRSGHLDLFSMRGPLWPTASVQFALEFNDARAPEGVEATSRSYFTLRRSSSHNQAVLALVRSIPGPQDIELQLNMDMFQNGVFSGVAVVKIYIYVTQYEF